MPVLYVENIPEDLYGALRARARQRHRSIAAEVLELLAQSIPTQKELKARKDLLRKLARIAAQHKLSDEVTFPSTEEMQRQDRQR